MTCPLLIYMFILMWYTGTPLTALSIGSNGPESTCCANLGSLGYIWTNQNGLESS